MKSGLFDRDYYLATYPDVANSKIDPIRHYLDHGAREMRNPCEFFNTKLYLIIYIDVADQAGSHNPLLHYILHGIKEGRSLN